jgi:hypothetical protein
MPDPIPTYSVSGGAVPVSGTAYRFATPFTRPAVTDYTAGDVIGSVSGSAIITMPNMGPPGGFIQIQSLRLLIYSATPVTTMTTVRAHFYSATPATIADNAAWDLIAADRSAYLDFIDFPTPTDLGSTQFSKLDWPGSVFKLAANSTDLFCLLQTVTAATFAENSTVIDLRVSAGEYGK